MAIQAPGQIPQATPTGSEVVSVNAGPVWVGVTTQKIANLAVSALASGTVTLTEATPVSVVNANVTANSVIVFTLKTVGGTVGAYPSVKTITPSTGFTVAGSASDTSIYNYKIIG